MCGLVPKPNVWVIKMSNSVLIGFYCRVSFKLLLTLVQCQSKFIVVLKMPWCNLVRVVYPSI